MLANMHVCHLQNAKNITYALSQQPWCEYAGGWAKFASVQEFPYSSKISGSLVELKAGGLRELHWHAPNEWAIVLNGTCRCDWFNGDMAAVKEYGQRVAGMASNCQAAERSC